MAKKVSPVVDLARETVERFIRDGVVIRPESSSSELEERAGVFVSIHKNGELRGCIGTFEPTRENVAEEIVANAISAATRDPRFPPVSSSELPSLDYNVDILTSPEPVESVEDLDPKKYGVIVECGSRRGLLLPDLEGVESVAQQIGICCMKAGIESSESVRLYRFEVRRFGESDH